MKLAYGYGFQANSYLCVFVTKSYLQTLGMYYKAHNKLDHHELEQLSLIFLYYVKKGQNSKTITSFKKWMAKFNKAYDFTTITLFS